MSDTSWFQFDDADGVPTMQLRGTWRLAQLDHIDAALAATRWPALAVVDGSALTQIDSAAALVLLRALQAAGLEPQALQWRGLAGAQQRIVQQVRGHLAAAAQGPALALPLGAIARLQRALAALGRQIAALAALLLGHLNFLGLCLVAMADTLRHPRRLRLGEFTVQLEQTGLNAIPVVALVTLLIGVVVAYLLGLQAEKYGANIFVVDGVGIGATREFAPIIVAVIVAGRSGAAFTAQLGSMRLTEETDAIRTLGLSPTQVLVLPRVLALMLALPLLVFVGDVMSLLGALLISGPMLDITPAAFLARLREALDLRHVLVGLVKAPVFALVIAVIGARMGMTVGRDTRALGAATTSTVVQSIVAVILLDALFAVVLQALDL